MFVTTSTFIGARCPPGSAMCATAPTPRIDLVAYRCVIRLPLSLLDRLRLSPWEFAKGMGLSRAGPGRTARVMRGTTTLSDSCQKSTR